MWISDQVLQKIEAEADSKFPNETGGVLAGYIAGNGDCVIQFCTGPGKNAQHGKVRFYPDHKWQCEQLDRVYSESKGVWVCLGDWHTHPNGRSDMSMLDKRTMARIAKYEKAKLPRPLMVIGGGVAGKWDWSAYSMNRFQLCRLIAVAEKTEINVFEGDF